MIIITVQPRNDNRFYAFFPCAIIIIILHVKIALCSERLGLSTSYFKNSISILLKIILFYHLPREHACKGYGSNLSAERFERPCPLHILKVNDARQNFII